MSTNYLQRWLGRSTSNLAIIGTQDSHGLRLFVVRLYESTGQGSRTLAEAKSPTLFPAVCKALGPEGQPGNKELVEVSCWLWPECWLLGCSARRLVVSCEDTGPIRQMRVDFYGDGNMLSSSAILLDTALGRGLGFLGWFMGPPEGPGEYEVLIQDDGADVVWAVSNITDPSTDSEAQPEGRRVIAHRIFRPCSTTT